MVFFFFFSSRRRHTRCLSEWSSDVCSSDLLMAVLQVRLAVKRRAAEIGNTGATAQADDPRSLRYASKIATQRLIDYTAKHYSGENAGDVKELRRRLIQAGYLDPRAPAFFFLARA